jgi:acetolactate decarboxylase
MVQRRDILKTSLTLCGCAACGALGTGGAGRGARADGPTVINGAGYRLWFIGAQRETIMNGKLAAALDLNTLAGRAHLYGLGPLEQLRGEVTIADSRPALARVAPDGTVSVIQSFAAGAPFFVWAEVPRWFTMAIPAEIRSYEHLERFVPRAAEAASLDAEKPLPFLVTGREELIEFHILNRIGNPPHNMEEHKKIQIKFELAKTEATIVGFHSTRHRVASSRRATAISTSISRPQTMTSRAISRSWSSARETYSACPRFELKGRTR